MVKLSLTQACAPLLLLAAQTHALDTLVLGSYVKDATYSVAQSLGFFANQGLNVTYAQIPNSTYGYAQLLAGAYDMVIAAADNVINRRFNQGLPFQMLGQVDTGLQLWLATAPNITSFEQLRGKPILVDAVNSGYVYMLRNILSFHGLELDNGDYSLVPAGGSGQRYSIMLSGSFNATVPAYASMLTAPFTVQNTFLPNATRLNILARTEDYTNPYVSDVFTAVSSALNNPTKRALLVRAMTAFYEANAYLAAPQNKHCAVKAIAAVNNVTMEVARGIYAVATDAVVGETNSLGGNFTFSRQGVINVIDVRRLYDGFGANVTEGFSVADALVPGMGKLIDYSVRDEAVAKANLTRMRCEEDCW